MENVSTLSDSSAEMLAAATAAEVWITLKFTWSSKEYTVTIAESDRLAFLCDTFTTDFLTLQVQRLGFEREAVYPHSCAKRTTENIGSSQGETP